MNESSRRISGHAAKARRHTAGIGLTAWDASRPRFFELYSSEKKQDQKNYNHQTKTAASIVA
jgi:hypothetical protein